MQVLLHTDPNTDGSHPMALHLETVAQAAMARFGGRVSRVEAHLFDVNSLARTGEKDIHCTLDAHLVGLGAIVVKAQAGNAHQAIEGALRKLRRAVGVALEKHDPRHQRAKVGDALTQAATDGPVAKA